MSDTSRNRNWPIWRRLLWCVLGALALAAFWIGPQKQFDRLHTKPGTIHDFFQEYASARNYHEGRPVYSPNEQTTPLYLQDAEGNPLYRDPNSPIWLKYNAHPPSSVMLAVPLGTLTYEQAFYIWNVFTLLIFVGCVAAIIWQLGGSPWLALPLLVLLPIFGPLQRHLLLGQLSIFLTLCLTAAWVANRNGKSWLGGAFIGIATALKIIPAFLFLYYLVRRDYKALASGAAAFLLVTAGTLGVLGTQTYADYFEHGMTQGNEYRSGWENASLWGFACRLFHPGKGDVSIHSGLPAEERDNGGGGKVEPIVKSPPIAIALYALLGLPLLAAVAWGVYRADTLPRQDLAFALCIAAMLLFSPVTWDHYLLMLLVPLGILAARLRVPFKPEIAVAVALLVLVVGALTNVPSLGLAKLGYLWPLAALTALVGALVSVKFRHSTWPQALVLVGVVYALFMVPLMAYLRNIPGGEIGTASPWISVSILSTQFYMLLAVVAFALGCLFRTPEAQPEAAAADEEDAEETSAAAVAVADTSEPVDEPAVEEAGSAAATEAESPAEPNVEAEPAYATADGGESYTDQVDDAPSRGDDDETAHETHAAVAGATLTAHAHSATLAPVEESMPSATATAPETAPAPATGPDSRVQTFLIVQAAIVLAGLAFAGYRYRAIETARELPQVDPFAQPHIVAPLYDEPRLISDAQLSAVLRRLVPRTKGRRTSIYDVEHALRMWGAKVEFREPDSLSGRQMQQLVTDQLVFEKMYGADAKTLLDMTPEGGVRARVAEDPYTSSSHYDHTLACLAEAGTDLGYPVITSEGQTTLEAMLLQSLRDFSLNQVEYEWSSLAYVLYLPPQVTSWYTGEGQHIDFNVLADRLMRQDMPEGVCSAHHRLHSLVMFLRVHEKTPILSEAMHDRIVAYLKDISRTLIATQHEDGYWNGLWPGYKPVGATEEELDTLPQRLLVTGHILEWWALAPEEVLPPTREPAIRAGQWLTKTVLNLSDTQVNNSFSYLTHVGRALALWRGQFPDEVDIYRGEEPQPKEAVKEG